MSRSGIESIAREEIVALEPYRTARSIVSGGDDRGWIFLDANESPWPGAGGAGSQLHRYPEPQPQPLLELASSCFGADRSNILMTRGVDEGIDLLLRAFCRPGVDSIAVCPPTYGFYGIAARIQGASITEIPFVRDGRDFRLDLEGLRVEADRELPARVLFLCSPNNPTGHSIPRDDVLAACSVFEGKSIVALDEAYVEFSGLESLVPRAGAPENLVVFRTLSKAWGLAGARFGLTFASPAVIDLLRKICAPYPLPTPTVELVASAMSPEGRAETARRVTSLATEKRSLAERLSQAGAIREVLPGDANFVLVRVDEPSSFVNHLLARGIVVRDRSREPGLAGFVRISVGNRQESDALLDGVAAFDSDRAGDSSGKESDR